MSNVVSLPRRNRDREDRHPALERLRGIQEALNRLDTSHLSSRADMSRTLNALDVANKCIRIVLNDYRDVPATAELIEQSAALSSLIEEARDKVSALRPCLF
ncbi:hypothetical protein [Bradyrhizobium centrosematis]|uniref:hypothetical protein n=1 Tax=Bradyrhizobium centrosematis TaxID=1300039 RepID=UPI00388D733E